jgi:hypothetical protein
MPKTTGNSCEPCGQIAEVTGGAEVRMYNIDAFQFDKSNQASKKSYVNSGPWTVYQAPDPHLLQSRHVLGRCRWLAETKEHFVSALPTNLY